MGRDHGRRETTEKKAKVVAAVGGWNEFNFLAEPGWLEEKDE